MFGCQLPVLAVRYACIDELVEDGRNGLLFDDATGLATKVLVCFWQAYDYVRRHV